MHAPNGLWANQNGYEYNLMLLVVALGSALIGPGQYALNAFFIIIYLELSILQLEVVLLDMSLTVTNRIWGTTIIIRKRSCKCRDTLGGSRASLNYLRS